MRLGTRGSALALAQAELVAELLSDDVEIVPIRTGEGSTRAGDKGRFVKEIEDALLAREVDLAVHSAKDLPAELPEGLRIVGVPEAADPRDAICGSAGVSELPEGAVIGTSSLRRRAQLLAARPDLEVRELRGNVDTRLGRLEQGAFDALVLAVAGLERLGRSAVGYPIDPAEMIPAPGQGCLALEARDDDDSVADAAVGITDPDALTRLSAERAVVAALGASCRTPVGAHARLDDRALELSAFAGLPDGSMWVRDVLAGDPSEPAALGEQVAERLLAAGAGEVLERAERSEQ